MSANSLGCREHPFGPGFDSRYFFVRPGQEEILAGLLAKISAREGLLLVTGQAGTGKTTLLRELMTELQSMHAVTVFLPNPAPTSDMLLDTCLERLGLTHSPDAERSRKLQALADALLRSGPTRPVAVLADEGHALTDDVLHTLLTLSGLNDKGCKLLPVVLTGEPVLMGRLSEELFLPLSGSISYRYQITPLVKEHVGPQWRSRLHAGGVQ